ncbi:MAG: HEPN domain-containing protein [Longimicrobiaceae bacterium]
MPPLDDALREWVARWVRLAEGDLALARLGLESNGFDVFERVGFHAQQAVEKLVKAFLARRAVEFGDVHDIDTLQRLERIARRSGADGLETRRWNGTKSAFADYAAALACPRPAALHLHSHAPAQASPPLRPPPSPGTGEGLRSQAQGEGAAAADARRTPDRRETALVARVDGSLAAKLDPAAALTRYAVGTRYPGRYARVTREQAETAVQIADSIRAEILPLLRR